MARTQNKQLFPSVRARNKTKLPTQIRRQDPPCIERLSGLFQTNLAILTPIRL